MVVQVKPLFEHMETAIVVQDPKNDILLKWENVGYTVKKDGSPKALLNGLNGVAKPGQLVGIMGASGAGKSTLLDALAGRIQDSGLTGSITLNGEQLSSNKRRRISAYVMQQDALLPMLTAKETLYFAAAFRMGTAVPKAQRAARVSTTLSDLGLAEQTNTRVGDESKRGLSGGEKRRLSIGCDIIHSPKLLFLDEPTSGLDSTSALTVVNLLQELAHKDNRTVVMTIHQPSHRVISMLDTIFLLSDGHCVYSGVPSEIPGYLRRINKEIPQHATVTEAALDVIAEIKQAPEGLNPLLRLHEEWIQEHEVEASSSHAGLASPSAIVAAERHNNVATESLLLLRRNSINTFRSRALTLGRLLFVAVCSFLLASVFALPDDSWNGVEKRVGFMAMCIAFFSFTALDALPVFVHEKQVIMRDTTTGAYHPLSYVLASVWLYIPVTFISALLHTLVVYWFAGLDTDNNMFETCFFYMLNIFLVLMVGNGIALFVSAAVPSLILATAVGTALTAFMFVFSGYFIPKEKLPIWWRWASYISAFKYALEAASINYFDNVDTQFECPKQMNIPGCKITGGQILHLRDMDGWDKWWSVPCLVGVILLWRVLFYVALYINRANSFRK